MHIASYLMATGFASLTFGQATVVVVSQIGDGQIQMPLPTVPAVVSVPVTTFCTTVYANSTTAVETAIATTSTPVVTVNNTTTAVTTVASTTGVETPTTPVSTPTPSATLVAGAANVNNPVYLGVAIGLLAAFV